MTDNKPDNKSDINVDVMLADAMLRITAIEKLLISKGVFTQEELVACTEDIAKRIAKGILEKMQGSNTIEEFVANLEKAVQAKEDKDKKDFQKN